MYDLSSFRGSVLLLNFWATSAPASVDCLDELQSHNSASVFDSLNILAVNVDKPAGDDAARSFASRKGLSFPVLFATEEIAGVYNIVYRYMFDRRRDLPIPISLMVDREGMIVKVYQGPVAVEKLLSDANSIPTNPSDRMRKALPFKGFLAQDSFQRNDFTYGVAMYQRGYLDQAAESFQHVIALKPDAADAYYNLGTLSLKRNNLPQARDYLEKTLQLQPNYPEAWNNLGMMAAQQGQLDEAIRNFEKSVQLRPGFPTALLNLGNVYRQQHSFKKAEECLAKALQLRPDDPEANYSLGMLYAQQGQLDRGREFLERALALRPAYPEALNNLGVLFVREEQYAQAEKQFKTGIEVAPGFDQSYLNLARLYMIQNESEKARRVLLDLLQKQPENNGAKQALEMLQ